jgi:hypothetical protein
MTHKSSNYNLNSSLNLQMQQYIWRQTMMEEMTALHLNNSWDIIVPLPLDKTTVGCRDKTIAGCC